MEQTVIAKTIVPEVPDQETFTRFWDKVREAGIMGLGSGVVNIEDHFYVVSPEIRSDEDEPGVLETLTKLLDYTIGNTGNGKIPYTYIHQTYDGVYPRDLPKNMWEVTSVLWYNPSAPSLYIFDSEEVFDLQVFKKSGEEVWDQIKRSTINNPKPFKFIESRLTLEDTSIRNIYVVKIKQSWAAINNRVVLP